MQKCSAILTVGVLWALSAAALERPDTTFKIFQFPADQIPRVDGDVSDWGMVPADYAIGIDQLKDTVHDSPIDTTDLDVTVRVGWVKGLNRLYFLYEAYDDYWDFSHRDLHNDILEIVVDGDLSGGPLIPQLREDEAQAALKQAGFLAHDPAVGASFVDFVKGQLYHLLGERDPALLHLERAFLAEDFRRRYALSLFQALAAELVWAGRVEDAREYARLVGGEVGQEGRFSRMVEDQLRP